MKDYSMTRVLASWVEGTATIVMMFLAWKLQDKPVALMPVLSWWATVSGMVLTLYGAKRITDKKLNEGAEK